MAFGVLRVGVIEAEKVEKASWLLRVDVEGCGLVGAENESLNVEVEGGQPPCEIRGDVGI